jgi:hypothetical protein
VADESATDFPKLKELILYVAQRMEDDNHIGRGRIKLAKLLWRCDFGAYWKLGAPITEAHYHADELGPVPTEELLATRDLETEERFEWRNEWDYQQIPIALDTPRLQVFSREQVAFIDEQLMRYRRVTGQQMVDEAHLFPGWLHAWEGHEGERRPVPLESVFWDDRTTLHDWEEEHALSLSQRLGSDFPGD